MMSLFRVGLAVGTSFVMTSSSLRRPSGATIDRTYRWTEVQQNVRYVPSDQRWWRNGAHIGYTCIYIYICVCMDMFGPVLRHFCIEWIAVLCTFGFRWSRFKMFFNFPFVFQLIYRYMNELSVGDIVRSVSVLSAFTYSSRIVGSFKDRVDS